MLPIGGDATYGRYCNCDALPACLPASLGCQAARASAVHPYLVVANLGR